VQEPVKAAEAVETPGHPVRLCEKSCEMVRGGVGTSTRRSASKKPMRRSSLLIVLVVELLASGCLGSSSSHQSAATARTLGVSAPKSVDEATKARLLAEYEVAVKTGGSSGPHSLVFLSRGELARLMNRIHPEIPATDSLNATLSLDTRVVFVLPETTTDRLVLATADSQGRYVRLVAVGAGKPRISFGPAS
jgi:hypothetical protein